MAATNNKTDLDTETLSAIATRFPGCDPAKMAGYVQQQGGELIMGGRNPTYRVLTVYLDNTGPCKSCGCIPCSPECD